MRRVTFADLTPAGRNNENLRDGVQIRDLPPRQEIGGRGLPPPRLRQHSLDFRTPPPTTSLSRRTGLGGASAGGGGGRSQSQPSILTDSEIRRNLRGRSTPGSFEQINRTMSGGPRDVGQVVRLWGFKFAGDPGENIDTFLESVEENWILAKLAEGEILSALSEQFVGVAGTWVRSNRMSWITWKEFCHRIRRWCGLTDRVQQRQAL